MILQAKDQYMQYLPNVFEHCEVAPRYADVSI